MNKTIMDLEKKIKEPNVEFVIHAVSRIDLFFLLGANEKALRDVNLLTNDEIQYVIDNLKTEENFENELIEKMKEFIEKKKGSDILRR